ncbi:ATP-binding protein [Vicingus serpentipes]|uniref:ATP-binding protein n=1 Tax=Vicingus serpentipes TaxID=1926625 RepID=A0A5C6RW51_9FLAO|nr:ATP-binding protein [Vicingus serpentipes]TXB66175.1 ATP-binding protein [Vicingus serpentipes]
MSGDVINIEPSPSSMLGSLRSIGYNLKTALADIIDNSIAAGASNIEIINNDLNSGANELDWVAIVDDGKGMTRDGIADAFTLGGKGVDAIRSESDLGRFGLGLKTASFSQCKRLTVISKTEYTELASLIFDIDYIGKNGWKVFDSINPESILEKIKIRLKDPDFFEKEAWTIVFWENLDKIEVNNYSNYYRQIEKVIEHFSLVFHKFDSIINIFVNNTEIEFWNPFEGATSTSQIEIPFDSFGNKFKFRGHVLRHRSEFKNESQYNLQSKFGTFFHNQGIFVYRNKRLIYRGGWLGLLNREHHHILARVEIDLSNSNESDTAWDVNISKSSVRIPKFTESLLSPECNSIIAQANDTFRFHGGIKKHKIRKKIVEKKIEPIWNFGSKGSKLGVKDYYSINKDHALYKDLLDSLGSSQKEKFNHLIDYLESYLPIDNIFARKSAEEVEQPYHGDDELREKFDELFQKFVQESKFDEKQAFEALIHVEPFNKLSFDKKQLQNLNIQYD